MTSKQLHKTFVKAFSVFFSGMTAMTPITSFANEAETPPIETESNSTTPDSSDISSNSDNQEIIDSISEIQETIKNNEEATQALEDVKEAIIEFDQKNVEAAKAKEEYEQAVDFNVDGSDILDDLGENAANALESANTAVDDTKSEADNAETLANDIEAAQKIIYESEDAANNAKDKAVADAESANRSYETAVEISNEAQEKLEHVQFEQNICEELVNNAEEAYKKAEQKVNEAEAALKAILEAGGADADTAEAELEKAQADAQKAHEELSQKQEEFNKITEGKEILEGFRNDIIVKQEEIKNLEVQEDYEAKAKELAQLMVMYKFSQEDNVVSVDEDSFKSWDIDGRTYFRVQYTQTVQNIDGKDEEVVSFAYFEMNDDDTKSGNISIAETEFTFSINNTGEDFNLGFEVVDGNIVYYIESFIGKTNLSDMEGYSIELGDKGEYIVTYEQSQYIFAPTIATSNDSYYSNQSFKEGTDSYNSLTSSIRKELNDYSTANAVADQAQKAAQKAKDAFDNAIKTLQKLKAESKADKAALEAAQEKLKAAKTAYDDALTAKALADENVEHAREEAQRAAELAGLDFRFVEAVISTGSNQGTTDNSVSDITVTTTETNTTETTTTETTTTETTTTVASSTVTPSTVATTPNTMTIIAPQVPLANTPDINTVEIIPDEVALSSSVDNNNLRYAISNNSTSYIETDENYEVTSKENYLEETIIFGETPEDLVTIEDEPVPVSDIMDKYSDITDTVYKEEKKVISWWWLIIIAIIGAFGYNKYRKARTKK